MRDNQRRSRARRKEYVQELENKIESCEQECIHATMEIELATERMKAENEHLRQVLHAHGIRAQDSPRAVAMDAAAGILQTTAAETVDLGITSADARRWSTREPPSLRDGGEWTPARQTTDHGFIPINFYLPLPSRSVPMDSILSTRHLQLASPEFLYEAHGSSDSGSAGHMTVASSSAPSTSLWQSTVSDVPLGCQATR